MSKHYIGHTYTKKAFIIYLRIQTQWYSLFLFCIYTAGNSTYKEFQTLILEILLLNSKQLDKYILLYIILNYVGI